jgi:hypothetical protein
MFWDLFISLRLYSFIVLFEFYIHIIIFGILFRIFFGITIQEQYVRAEGFLKEHMDKLHKLHDVLMKKETMTVEEFIEIFEGRAPTKEEIAEVSADAVPAALETAVSDEDGAEEATEQE